MFTRIAFTLSSEVRILNASTTWIEKFIKTCSVEIDAAQQTTMHKNTPCFKMDLDEFPIS